MDSAPHPAYLPLSDLMSPTLLEGATAIILLWIAWRIGSLLAPRIIWRWRQRHTPGHKWQKPEKQSNPPDSENKPPFTVDI